MHQRSGILLFVTFAVVACNSTAADWPPAPPIETLGRRDVGLLPPTVAVEHADDGFWDVTWHPQYPDAQRVQLAGSFNGWIPGNGPMQGPDGEGRWTYTMHLGPGEHLYKYVVDGRWRHDAQNLERVPDGHGGSNSVLRLGRLASLSESDATVGDGEISSIAIAHTQQAKAFFEPLSEDEVLLRYRTLAHDVEHVLVAVRDGEQTHFTPMYLASQDMLFAYWEAFVTVPERRPRQELRELLYTFVLEDGKTRVSDPSIYSKAVMSEDVFSTPEWAKHAVWYQIMVDRFRNGATDNDPPNAIPWTQDWFSAAPHEGANGQTFYKWYVYSRLYGGDLQGLREKLGYLKELGVNALYLNPIFQSHTHHKYDAQSYVHVDEFYGEPGDYDDAIAKEDLTDPSTWVWTKSDRIFLDFLKEAKAQGFRVIVDGVFNHVGERHPAFVDVKKNKKASKYADWFEIKSWEPFEHRGWAGHGSLPEFRKDEKHGIASDSAREHIFNVTRRWMDPDGDGDPRDGIDGWRLDVPMEIPHVFWIQWRKLVKSLNPEAYITGEVWDRADEWLDGDQFDAVMNYQFCKPAIDWVINQEHKIPVSTFDKRLADLRMAYPAAATYVMQNLLDSHDTDRVASMALNPDRAYDTGNRAQDEKCEYDNSKPGPVEYAKVRLLVLLQMTYVGAPMVYYGDEVGMWGADDPTCRKPMLWKDLEPYEHPEENHVMEDHLAWFKQAIALRNAHPALRTGHFRTLHMDDAADVWVFSRFDEQEELIVALNASGEDAVAEAPLPASAPRVWRVVFSGGDVDQHGEPVDSTCDVAGGMLKIKVPALGGTVLHSAAREPSTGD